MWSHHAIPLPKVPKSKNLPVAHGNTPAVAQLFQKFGIFDSITVYFIVIGCH
jgi:hypothetical protein